MTFSHWRTTRAGPERHAARRHARQNLLDDRDLPARGSIIKAGHH